MEEFEKNKQELEDVSYVIDCIDNAINILKQHKEDFKDDIETLTDMLHSCEQVADSIEAEMREQEERLMAEHRYEVECANAEFERSKL